MGYALLSVIRGQGTALLASLIQPADIDDISAKANSILRFYDLSRITLISKVLGLMCDGQFRSMQNFLREQSEDINSVNMVGEIASFLYGFSKKHVITEKTMILLTQLLKALNEFCIGNYKNREVTFNENIVSVINFVLQIDITKIKRQGRNENTTVVSNLSAIDDLAIGRSADRESKTDYVQLRAMALTMKASAVQLLDALLEEISNKTSRLSHQIAEGLDIHALHWSMLDFFVLKSDPDMIKLRNEDNAYKALFDIYKIIMHLADTGVAPLQSLSEWSSLSPSPLLSPPFPLSSSPLPSSPPLYTLHLPSTLSPSPSPSTISPSSSPPSPPPLHPLPLPHHPIPSFLLTCPSLPFPLPLFRSLL